jgi:Cysteine rich repeat
MTRFLFVIPLVLPFVLIATAASAQYQSACTRDAQRFCRPYLNDGDMAVLACLKQNRAKLSKGCVAELVSHGQ